MKKLLFISAVLFLTVLSSCKKDDEGIANITITKGDVTSSSINITWTAVGGDYTFYDLDYAISGEELEYEQSFTQESDLEYTLSELTPNTEYTIKITSYDLSESELGTTTGEGTIKIKTAQAAI